MSAEHQRSSSNSLALSDVVIGVLTALPEEYEACLGIFDPAGDGIEVTNRATSGTFNASLCKIPAKGGGDHVVAITLMSDMGNTSAAIAANILMQHCEKVRFLIMCGVAGVAPNPKKTEHHVRLGDIVVSEQVLQYDRGKQYATSADASSHAPSPNAFPEFELRYSPTRPSAELLDVARRLEAAESRMGRDQPRPWEILVEKFLGNVQNDVWKRPSADVLDDSENGSARATHPKRERSRRPIVFRGTIAAANIVLADPARRNFLRDNYGVRAIEMEGAGIADASWIGNVAYLIIRSGCDYCNLLKNKYPWHHHAALTAAAYARTVIENLHPLGTSEDGSGPAAPAPRPLDHFPVGHPPLHVPQEYRPSSNLQLPFETVAIPPNVTPDQSSLTSVPPEPSPTAVDLGPTQPPIPSAAVGARQSASAPNQIDELCNEIKSLLAESRFRAEQRSHLLEELLKTAPRTGQSVKNGLILLARIESLRLQDAKQQNQPVDLTRLRALRQEIDNVVD
jgi:nucleoside phosphorylase